MRTTVTLDDALYQEALEIADPSMDKADLFTLGELANLVRDPLGINLAGDSENRPIGTHASLILLANLVDANPF